MPTQCISLHHRFVNKTKELEKWLPLNRYTYVCIEDIVDELVKKNTDRECVFFSALIIRLIML